jgi:DNA-binding response OmpR family regulator
MARVRALLRRSRPERIAKHLYAGDLDLDRETRQVRRGTRDIHLGPTEFRLLEFLLEKPGRVFTRTQLLDNIWGQAAESQEYAFRTAALTARAISSPAFRAATCFACAAFRAAAAAFSGGRLNLPVVTVGPPSPLAL